MSRVGLEKKAVDKAYRPNGSKHDWKKPATDENRSQVQTLETANENITYHGVGYREMLIENTYMMAPNPLHKFYGDLVDKVVSDVLSRELKDAVYSLEFSQKMAIILARKIMDEVKALKFKRYKLVAIVNIGNADEKPTVHVFSRCLWNSTTDSYSSVVYSNPFLYAVAMVFAAYLE